MPDYKKLDDENILIKSEPLTPSERAAFSAFLKQKAKKEQRPVKLKTKAKKSVAKR